MDSSLFSKKKSKPPRVASEEDVNREGHWSRNFSVRSDLWPIVEHWASEKGFHLVASRGQQRRQYQKGANPSFYTSNLDIKLHEGRVTITAWIQVGMKARLLHFFTLPSELQVSPSGMAGASHRRPLCREINILLERLKQPIIGNTNGFHIADLDATTRILTLLYLVAEGFFLAAILRQVEIAPGLSPALLAAVIKPGAYLFGAATALVVIHYFAVVKHFVEFVWRVVSAAVSFGLFSVLAILLLTHTSNGMRSTKVTYHCVQNPNEQACKKALDRLSPEARDKTLEQLQWLQDELTRRP